MNKASLIKLNIILAVSLFAHQTSASTHTPIVISLPCAQAGSRCNLPFLNCSLALKSIEKSIQTLLNEKISYFYSKGMDVDLFATTDPNNPKGTGIQLPICNLGEGEINQSHLHNQPNLPPTSQRDCGQLKNYVVGGAQATGGHGVRETAYLYGLYAQSWKCYKQQVFNEIENSKSVTIRYATTAAQDYKTSYDALNQEINNGGLSVICSLPSYCTSELDQCSQASNDASASACHKIAICKLQATQLKLESAFKYIVFQEIESRAMKSWLDLSNSIETQIFNQVEIPCMNSLSCTPPLSLVQQWVSQDPGCMAEGMNKCYPDKYLKFMQSLSQSQYPDNGACQ